MNKYSRLCRFL